MPYIPALGRRAQVDKPALRLSQLLTGVLPDHPLTVDNTSGVRYGLDRNDVFGVCVPTGFDNLRRMTTRLLTGTQVAATQDQVYAWYRTQNPGFDPGSGADDNGMVIQDFLAYLAKQGDILAFARVDVTDDDELTAALYLFLGLLWGLDLQQAQQGQLDARVWDYVPSGQWGGHCVLAAAYEASDTQDVITWGERVATTDAFRRHQLSEAWVVVLPEHIAHPQFRAGVDLERLGAAYTAITGRVFPVLPAVPGGASFPGSSAGVDQRVARAAARAKVTSQEWMERHLRSYFDL